jgi:hypothetical protein
MKKSNKKFVWIGLGIFIILIIGAIVLTTSLTKESVLGVSNVNVGTDGKVYWLLTASANSPGEQYVFTSTPSKYTKTDGTTVTPKEGITLVINPKVPQCVYQSQLVTKKNILGITLGSYYVFNNPEKVIDIDFTDRDGQTKTLDATTVQSLTIQDSDGNGKLVIQTQGSLSGKIDCSNYDNVAMMINNKGEKAFYYKNEIDQYIGSLSSIWNVLNLPSITRNTAFTNKYSKVTWDGSNLIAENSNLGYGVFTVTADQDYFDSVVVIPSIPANPKISSINLPSEINADGSGSMVVQLTNSGDKGTVEITTTSSTVSISPSSANLVLDKTGSYSFTLKAGSSEKCGNVNVKVCSTSQFTSSNCDSKSESICIVSQDVVVKEECGDGTCQSSETTLTCPSDCKEVIITNNTQPTCKWYQDSYTSSEKVCSFLFFGCETKPVSGCKTSAWVGWVIVLLIVSSIIGIIILIKKFIKKLGA